MRKSGLTGDEAYVLAKHGKATEDLGPLKKEVSSLKEDLGNLLEEGVQIFDYKNAVKDFIDCNYSSRLFQK